MNERILIFDFLLPKKKKKKGGRHDSLIDKVSESSSPFLFLHTHHLAYARNPSWLKRATFPIPLSLSGDLLE